MALSTPPRRRGRPPKAKQSEAEAVMPIVAHSLDEFLGPLPVLGGEDPVEYQGLLDEVRRQVAPVDSIEQIYIRDIVDLTWELMRARRIKVGLLHKGQVRAMNQFGATENWPGLGHDARRSISAAAAEGFTEGLKALQKHGVTLNDVNAYAFAAERETILRLDQSMLQIEGRRNFSLREIERRRASFGRRLDKSVHQVEAEFTEFTEDGASTLAGEE